MQMLTHALLFFSLRQQRNLEGERMVCFSPQFERVEFITCQGTREIGGKPIEHWSYHSHSYEAGDR